MIFDKICFDLKKYVMYIDIYVDVVCCKWIIIIGVDYIYIFNNIGLVLSIV